MSLDFYCERLSDQFWAEPINALTNIGFLLVGLWWAHWSFKNNKTWPLTLSLLCILTGLGSFLFHTYANSKTHLMDLVPIFLFTVVFVFFTFLKTLEFKKSLAVSGSFVFVLCMALIEIFVPKSVLNGSLLYFPPLITLFVVSFSVLKTKPKIAKLYFLTGLVFLLSLVFRSIDNFVCEHFVIGTHFLWHLLNSFVLGIMIQISGSKS